MNSAKTTSWSPLSFNRRGLRVPAAFRITARRFALSGSGAEVRIRPSVMIRIVRALCDSRSDNSNKCVSSMFRWLSRYRNACTCRPLEGRIGSRASASCILFRRWTRAVLSCESACVRMRSSETASRAWGDCIVLSSRSFATARPKVSSTGPGTPPRSCR